MTPQFLQDHGAPGRPPTQAGARLRGSGYSGRRILKQIECVKIASAAVCRVLGIYQCTLLLSSPIVTILIVRHNVYTHIGPVNSTQWLDGTIRAFNACVGRNVGRLEVLNTIPLIQFPPHIGCTKYRVGSWIRTFVPSLSPEIISGRIVEVSSIRYTNLLCKS